MTKIQHGHPVLFPSERNQNKAHKQHAGQGLILAIAGIGIMALVVYMAMIVFVTTQS